MQRYIRYYFLHGYPNKHFYPGFLAFCCGAYIGSSSTENKLIKTSRKYLIFIWGFAGWIGEVRGDTAKNRFGFCYRRLSPCFYRTTRLSTMGTK